MKEIEENFVSAIIKRKDAECYGKRVTCIARNDNGAATKTETIMSAITKSHTSMQKRIIIDDMSGYVSEEIRATDISGAHYTFCGCNLTGYRCAEMTALAIDMLYGKPRRVGFLGTGKTNLLNCIAIHKYFLTEDIVIRGSKRNLAKNAGDFFTICENVKIDTSDCMRLLNECDVVVECCSNCSRDELISSYQLSGPKLIVALDCGFLLDESFRLNRVSFSDWPEQLEGHYAEEFVFDRQLHNFKQMSYDHDEYDKAVVYLYGVAIADAVAAERMIEAVKDDNVVEPTLRYGGETHA